MVEGVGLRVRVWAVALKAAGLQLEVQGARGLGLT